MGGYDPGRLEVGQNLLPIAYAQGLVGWWRFEYTPNMPAPDASDSSPQGNNGTWVGSGGDLSSDCKVGQCVDFDGTEDEEFIVSDNTALGFQGSDDFTVVAWAKMRDCQTSGSKIFENKYDPGYESFQLQCYPTYADFNFRDSNNNEARARISRVMDDNQWHFWTGVKFGNTAYLYIDAELQASTSTTVTGDFTPAVIRIGDSVDAAARKVNGIVDEVRVYRRALTTGEIEAIYKATQ